MAASSPWRCAEKLRGRIAWSTLLPRPRVVCSKTRELRRPEPAWWVPGLAGPPHGTALSHGDRRPPHRDFRIEDGKAVIPLGTAVQGDVLIVIYHARSTLGGRLQAKVSALRRPRGP